MKTQGQDRSLGDENAERQIRIGKRRMVFNLVCLVIISVEALVAFKTLEITKEAFGLQGKIELMTDTSLLLMAVFFLTSAALVGAYMRRLRKREMAHRLAQRQDGAGKVAS